MAIIKCKMCGGDLALIEGQSVAECEYCGSRQTVPVADNEKKLTLFARANRLRASCEFDKAAGIYESIVADFPEEAEAYWGLVLCKYGIEYVDDPGTGKKVPTCHRSSFDSVMDDSNFEQAMENADPIALRVYREEAKQIETIRKGILEVSSNERPYDIFICYKETDENGDRTVDSVMAQDLYTALTDKGYRVFFARITLREKLGEAYEPYIFAALNSAKVMLAIGTCYEYYNAVWVKNEWSRYLKICAADKSKRLIPCYKGIDAYDMPKEFKPLQAVDLGQMGAVQDILFNMEKYIPLKKETVVQERVVVGGSGNNKIASLLDRGNMALEDGDWAKADSFFEDVLNNDSKNAQAYLGKTLAMEKCRTIDAFIRKRKAVYQQAAFRKLQFPEDTAHVENMEKQYSVPGFMERESIRKLYGCDRSYDTAVESRKAQYKEEEAYWANHKLLSRAEQFAEGAVAANLAAEKKALFDHLADTVKQAEAAETAGREDAQRRYAAHKAKADQQAQALQQQGLKLRERYYQDLMQIAKNSANVTELKDAANKFEWLGEYQDSKNLAEHCRKRAAEEQAKLDAERERQRLLREKQEKERKALNKKLTVVFLIAAVLIVAAVFVVTQVIIPQNNYKTAQQLLEAGEYEEAADAFEKMGDYKDSQEQVLVAKYADGEEKLAKGKYFEAVYAFDALGEYRDAPERCLEAKTAIYDAAIALLEAGNYREAIEAIDQAGGVIGELPDVDKNKKYAEAMILLQDGKYEKAQEAFSALGDFRNSADMEKEASDEIAYINAKKLLEEENYTDALSVFRYLESFKDSPKYVEQICGVLYDKALGEYLASKPVYLEQTLAALEKLPSDFRDVEKYKKEISSLIHKYDGHYYRYVGSEYLDSCEFTFNGEEYHFYYTWGVNTYNYDKYNMKIKWAVENGNIVYGSAYTYTDKLIFTPTAGGMKVTSDDDSRYAGFYSKKN